MLVEARRARQVEGEPFRRWFSDNEFDLIVWYGEAHNMVGFQLCYKTPREERALTWLEGRGYSHNRVDDGETAPSRHKMTPILVADGAFDRDHILNRFREVAKDLEPDLVSAVAARLRDYPGAPHGKARKR